MTIKVTVDGNEVESKIIKFSDGALNLQIDHEAIKGTKHEACFEVSPLMDVTSAMYIIQLAELIFDTYVPFMATVSLSIPYFPQARADRQFEEGMAIPLLHFKRILDNGNWDAIYTKDIHNPKPLHGLRNLKEQSQRECFDITMKDNPTLAKLVKNGISFCAPDKGASTKVQTVSHGYSTEIIQLEKCRNVSTGKIQGIDIVNGNVNGKDVLIVDDICDGGMTFLAAAEELKYNGAKSVSLYVTHGIFSKGLVPFMDMIDYVFVHQVVSNYITMEDIHRFNEK